MDKLKTLRKINTKKKVEPNSQMYNGDMRNITSYIVWNIINESVFPEKKKYAEQLAKRLVKLGYTSDSIESQFKVLGYLDSTKEWTKPKSKPEIITKCNQISSIPVKKSFWKGLWNF